MSCTAESLEGDPFILTWEQILEQERMRIRERRRQAGFAPGQPEKDAVGLAFQAAGFALPPLIWGYCRR